MTSTIRRETPAMSDAEFEQLDVLSGGKLRHFLLGSPSARETHTEVVDRILTFENMWREWERIPAKDQKLLPKHKRILLLESVDTNDGGDELLDAPEQKLQIEEAK